MAKKVTPRTIKYAERRQQALKMRAMRFTYDDIAKKLYNGNKGNCFRDIQKAFVAIDAEDAKIVRQQEVELLDMMARGLVSRAVKGDDKAVKSMLGIMDRRSKLLGLDTPLQIDQTGGGVVNVVFDSSLQVTGMDDAELVVDPT